MAEREEKFRTHRLVQIDGLIREGSYPSVDLLVEKFGVSRRTILRDIDFLRDRYNAPIEVDRTRKGYYYSDPTFLIQNVLLTEGDLFTVSTVMPLMEQYKNTPLENSFRNIMVKIADMLPEQVSVNSGFLNKDVSFISDPLPAIDEGVFENIFSSIRLRKTLHFKYRSVSRTEYIEKIFDPYHVLCKKGNWYVIGYDQLAHDKRVYALHRFKDVRVTEESFEIPEDFRIEDAVDLSFGIWYNKDSDVEYELLFDAKMSNYITEREWHKNQEIEKKEDGSVLLKFISNQKQQILSWILGFGDSVTVIAPETLKQEVILAAQKMLKKYK